MVALTPRWNHLYGVFLENVPFEINGDVTWNNFQQQLAVEIRLYEILLVWTLNDLHLKFVECRSL